MIRLGVGGAGGLGDGNHDPHHVPSIYLWALETRKDDITRTGTAALLRLPLRAEEPYPMPYRSERASNAGELSFHRVANISTKLKNSSSTTHPFVIGTVQQS